MPRSYSRTHHRRGFTLVELMATMVIIGIMATALLSGLSMVRDRAAYSRTQQTIARLNEPVRRRYESYRTRRLPVDVTMEVNKVYNTIASRQSTDYRSALNWRRLWGMRELIRMEMPETYQDIQFTPVFLLVSDKGGGNPTPYVPRLRDAYLARVQATAPSNDLQSNITAVANWPSAELLYALVTITNEDRDVMSMAFSPSDVGDVDADGMPEFLDGWGRPLCFVRWPAGYVSELQPLLQKPSLNNSNIKNMTSLQRQALAPDILNQTYQYNPFVYDRLNNQNIFYVTRDPANRHDPLDPRKVDRWQSTSANTLGHLLSATRMKAPSPLTNSTNYGWPERGFLTMPLIVSPGADGEYGLNFITQVNSASGPQETSQNPYATFTNPYYQDSNTYRMRCEYYDQTQLQSQHLLQVADPLMSDNIDNHGTQATLGGI